MMIKGFCFGNVNFSSFSYSFAENINHHSNETGYNYSRTYK